jgi:hypothetical protein
MSKQQEIVQKLVATLMEVGADINALTDLGVDVHGTVMPSLVAAIRKTVASDVLIALYQAYVGAIKQVYEERPVERAIRRALAAAASPIPDQTPAVEAHIVLRGLPQTLSGSLSVGPEGGLRMLSPAGQGKLVEQFFGYEDVVVFAQMRDVTVESPRLFRSS